MSSGQPSPMESIGGERPHGDARAPVVSAKKLWRAMRGMYLVVVKKHQPKLSALGVHLHRLLSSSRRDDRHRSLAAREHSTALSCRSMDPAAAVVHPYPRGHGGRRRASSSRRPAAAAALSCRSMDPAAAVHQYQYRPREVEFSCKSTPMHKRRRREQRRLRLQGRAGDQGPPPEPEYHASVAAVTRLFELMDVEEVAEETGVEYDDGDLDLETAVAWPALTLGPAPRQVRITDSPYLAWEDESDELRSAVDRRADEFIMWFHEQLRTQQPRTTTTSHYRVR
ncbi:hypothetical protein BS78_09G206800 [Paspalum vaginatum]|nr:hypothetical protein BS78_09G206800 [Paspalum vaginatum]